MTTPTPSTKPPKTHIAQTLLSRAHSPDTAADLFADRIKQKPLYLRPTSPTPADNRDRRRHHRLRKKEYFLRKQKPRALSAREKRASGIYDLTTSTSEAEAGAGKSECKYEIFKTLNGLWAGYMQEILDLKEEGGAGRNVGAVVTPLSHGSKLASADFHGAEVQVVRSRCQGRVGVKGIVVRDTKFTFVVVTEGDVVKTIPKEQTIFRFTVPLPESKGSVESDAQKDENAEKKELTFELHGSQFLNRPVDRANKKFKWRNVEYL
ncbi:ribonuclease P complex subunit Pop4 [Aspergillus steynii IBT 23096]|uniref:Ribonuclease P protein subunit n=1 Tax=Aspergillus steynii IBT 23096 TaxID=1392250 RepID=A0A2I2G2U3_9EURO|nr:ribonuclease P complex subunit Pop4 [Aspergillus steynii IBT 23096]PLB47203.1 ribonuclease P complex subunit Pop4 [Aspergillus steynii IBT 23096]